MFDPRSVTICQSDQRIDYPQNPPFRPSENYPEFFGQNSVTAEQNPVYQLCRQLFYDMGLDLDNRFTPNWNPLGDIIKPGNKVVIKPNMVRHIHLKGGVYEAVVTHGSVVRCILDYVALALKGKGEIVVGDAPVQSADFNQIIERTGLRLVCEEVSGIWGIPVRIVDFRLWALKLDENHCKLDGNYLAGDPSGYQAVDLGNRSLLAPLAGQYDRFRVTSYDCREMIKHHNQSVNEYLIPKTILEADIIINLPKLKTHRKVGLTAALKNLVGINGHKDWLPHHRCGSVDEGGDEYLNKSCMKKTVSELECRIAVSSKAKSISKLALKFARKFADIQAEDPYEEGSWYGNDTLWRTVLDLNRLLVYADCQGIMRENPQRICFTIVDGIIAGEGEGPMEPMARSCNVLVGGINQTAIDAVLATMIGFDYRRIPIISKGFGLENWPLVDFRPEEITVNSLAERWLGLKVGMPCNGFDFLPPSGWKGFIEYKKQ